MSKRPVIGDIVYDLNWYGKPGEVTEIVDDVFTVKYGKGLTSQTPNVVLVVVGTKCCACACDVTVDDVPTECEGHDVWLCNRCRIPSVQASRHS